MEASNPHLRLPSISAGYPCTSNRNQPVYNQSQHLHPERLTSNVQAPGFVSNTNRLCASSGQITQPGSKLEDQTAEQNSHGDHQCVSTLTKMNNCMTNSTPINSVSTDSSCNFSHATNVNHTNQLGNSIQYEHGTHNTNLTSVQYNHQQQQAKEQHSRAGQYSGDSRPNPYANINRIEQLQQLELQQQQLNYQQLVQQHTQSQQQQQHLQHQQQLIRNQNQIPQQILLQQGEHFPQTLNPAQQQYLLQQKYHQQQQQHQQHQQQVNLQQQIAYHQQQQQHQYLASQNSYEGPNANQVQTNQQALFQQHLAYQQHLVSQQQATESNEQGVKQESLDTQQQALLQQIAFQHQNIKTEANGQQTKQDGSDNISQQHQPAVQISYQHPTSIDQGNQNLKQEAYEQQSHQSVLPQHIPYHQIVQQQNLKSELNTSVDQDQSKPESRVLIPNQILQQQIAYQANTFKQEHVTQVNKEIAVQNQLILQQQLAYQQQLLAQQQQQQNSGKKEIINPVFFQNNSQAIKPESSGTVTPQQAFIQQQQLAYQHQLLAQQQNSVKAESSDESQFETQTSHQLKQETIETTSSDLQQNIVQQQTEYQQQQQQQQTAVKLEPSEISQKSQIQQESVEQNLNQHQQNLLLQQGNLLKPDQASGKQESLVSLPVQHNLQLQPSGTRVLSQQIPAHQILSGHSLPPQFAQPVLSVTRNVTHLPGKPLVPSGDSQQQTLPKVEPLLGASHQLLPGQICQVLSNGQKIITNQPLSISSQNVGLASHLTSVDSDNGQSSEERSVESESAPSKIRVVPYGKVLKESNLGATVKSEQSEKSSTSETASASGKPFIRVPLQWKRLIANNMVIYVR
ncbi:hypothetical protein M8J77_021989 [Diaphorina citri]|nr:hypothetical protein M8J77_021989 [Diaphorina citri]